VVRNAASGDTAADYDDLRAVWETGLYHVFGTDYSGRHAGRQAIDELIDVVPELRGERVVTELAGGLTNTNYKVETDQGTFVVRISAKDSGLLAIDRENEYQNTVTAAEEGVGPAVIGYIPERSLMVLEFIEGQTQSAEDLRRGDKIEMVAHACRRLHGAGRFRDDFNMFDIQRRYLALVQDRGFRLPDRYLEFEPAVREIERAMAVRDEGTVPCNNDLLAENFIDTGGEFRLIDYEYSGNNDACFELGNVWSESTCRSTSSTSWWPPTTAGRCATRWPGRGCGG
jgi:thiamine kinase-like enzyme